MTCSCHYLPSVLVQFFQLSCSESFQVSIRRYSGISPSTRTEAPELTPHAGSAQSEFTDCCSINTAKDETPPATPSSVDTARRAYAAGICENTDNFNITVCKY